MSQNKKWSAGAKFEIALLALKGETTLNEICTRYQVSPSQEDLYLLHERQDYFREKMQLFKNR